MDWNASESTELTSPSSRRQKAARLMGNVMCNVLGQVNSMENKSKLVHIVVELFKYPILVVFIVLGVIALKYSLGLEFGMVTEFSTNGLKFSERSNKATLKAISELESKLNEVTVKIADIERRASLNADNERNVQLNAFSASQSVSDETANIAKLKPPTDGKDVERIIGYIWIGNYNGQWERTTLANLSSGQPINIAPMKIQAGTKYTVLGNMVIRDGLPPNNEKYYRARNNVGVVPRGSDVSVLSKPEGIKRKFATQYWAKIEYLSK